MVRRLEHSQIAHTQDRTWRRQEAPCHTSCSTEQNESHTLSKILPQTDCRADTARSASTQLLQLRFRSFQPQSHFHLAHHCDAIGEMRLRLLLIIGSPIQFPKTHVAVSDERAHLETIS